MPLDPSISLHVVGGATGPADAGGGAGPFGMVNSYAAMQEKLNSIKLFKAEFAAKQKFGQIIANAPDMATGVAAAQQDPDVAAFAPQLAASAAGTYGSLLGSAGQVQAQGQDAFSNMIKKLPTVLQDPGQWDSLVHSSLELASPAIRPQLAKSFGYLKDSLTSGLSDDPVKAKEQMNQRLTGWSIAAGAGDAIPRILGEPQKIDTGDKIQTGVTAPPQGGPNGEAPGSITPANSLEKTIQPGAYAPGSIPYKGGGTGGNSLSQDAPASPSRAPAPSGPAKSAPTGEPTSGPLDKELALDGKPLFPKGFSIPKPKNDSFGNVPVGPAGDIAAGLAKKFVEQDTHRNDNAQQTLGLLDQIDSAFDSMHTNGGFLQPGAGAQQRLQLGNLMNTVSSITGGSPVVNPTGLASAEDAVKATQQLGVGLTTQLLGNQREAAETITNLTKAVPSITNSYLGGKLLTSIIRASAERSVDLYNWENKWQEQNKGDLTGAEAAFNKARPMSTYTQPVLKSFGMTEEGFDNRKSLDKAFQKGWITKEQAKTIMRQQKFKLGEE